MQRRSRWIWRLPFQPQKTQPYEGVGKAVPITFINPHECPRTCIFQRVPHGLSQGQGEGRVLPVRVDLDHHDLLLDAILARGRRRDEGGHPIERSHGTSQERRQGLPTRHARRRTRHCNPERESTPTQSTSPVASVIGDRSTLVRSRAAGKREPLAQNHTEKEQPSEPFSETPRPDLFPCASLVQEVVGEQRSRPLVKQRIKVLDGGTAVIVYAGATSGSNNTLPMDRNLFNGAITIVPNRHFCSLLPTACGPLPHSPRFRAFEVSRPRLISRVERAHEGHREK